MTERDQQEIVRHEEELAAETQVLSAGAAYARKRVEVEKVEEGFPRRVERAEVERVAARDGDSGEVETLPDGSISIPVLEEELVVTKRTVVRERIVIRKEVVTEQQRVEAELRRERVDVEVDEVDPADDR
jgi:uncharacterized protein (TIGR02271 family)